MGVKFFNKKDGGYAKGEGIEIDWEVAALENVINAVIIKVEFKQDTEANEEKIDMALVKLKEALIWLKSEPVGKRKMIEQCK